MRSFQQNSRYQNTVGEVQKLLQMYMTLRNLSKDVFQRRVSTGNDALSHLTCLNATKIVLLSVLCLAEHLGKTTAHWCKKPTSGCKNPTSGCKNPTSGWRAPCLSCLLPAGSSTSQRTFSALWRLNFFVKRTQKRHNAKADTSITDEVSFDYVWYVISCMTTVLFFFSYVQVSYIDLAKNSGYGEFAKLVEVNDTTSSHLILNWSGI